MCPAINTDKRSKVYQWLSYFSASLHPAFGHALFPTRLVAAEQAENFKIGALERLKDVLNYIEKSFLASGFLLEDHATIVDAQAYALLRWGKGFKGGTPIVDISKYPKITHFLNLMEQQVAVKNALAIEEEHLNNLQNSQFAGYFTLA